MGRDRSYARGWFSVAVFHSMLVHNLFLKRRSYVEISCEMRIKSEIENVMIMFSSLGGIMCLHYELDSPFSALHYVSSIHLGNTNNFGSRCYYG